MGLQVPKLSGAPIRRSLKVALLGVTMLVLAGCSAADTHQIRNLAMPDRVTAQGPYTYELWKWAWVAAMVTGVIVWGLIFYAVVKFRRRSDDEVPRQTRYNLPLEVFYTIAPVLMCVVFFFHTVRVQDEVIKIDPEPDMTVEVMGQQWSWTFNYGVGEQDPTATAGEDENGEPDFAYDDYVYSSGTGRDIPTLVPAGRPDDPVQPALARRHPRLRRAVLPREDGRHPRPGQQAPGHPDRRGHLRRQVLRALRCLPLADALQRQGREPGRLRRLPRRARRRRQHRRVPAARRQLRPTTRPASTDDSEGSNE